MGYLKAVNDALDIKNMEEGTSNQRYPFDELAITLVNASGGSVTGYSFQGKDYTYQIDAISNFGFGGLVATRKYSNNVQDWMNLNIVNGKRYCLQPPTLGKNHGKEIGFSNKATGVGCSLDQGIEADYATLCYVE